MENIDYQNFYKNYKSKFHNGNTTNTYVNFKVFNSRGGIEIETEPYPTACYSSITYSNKINNWSKMETWFSLKKLPYTKTKIIEWTEEINNLGFPCYLDFENKNSPKTANFTVKFSDFTKKLHLNCTLQLIRCLWESGINHVPDIYFQLLEKYENPPDLNERFVLLQHSHNIINYTKDITGYHNINHMITYYNNGIKNGFINLEEYKNRLKESVGIDKVVYGGVHKLWRRNLI